MTTLEKLKSLKNYLVGQTLFKEKTRRYFAVSYYNCLIETEEEGYEFDIDEIDRKMPVLYAPTMEEVIDKAFAWEQENL